MAWNELFNTKTLTSAVNEMREPGNAVFRRHFARYAHAQKDSRLQFDIITGSEKILKTISIYAPAVVTEKTGRKTVTMEAPRLSHKRFIHTAEMESLRGYGEELGLELLARRVTRELMDMRNMSDRTLEFWAANALRGKIYDSDHTTVLLDFGLPANHEVTLATKWDATDSDPLKDIRDWKRIIKEDLGTAINGWTLWVGYEAMDALLTNATIRELIKYTTGSNFVSTYDISQLAQVEVVEYDASYVDDSSVRQYFIPPKMAILVAEADDVFDCPFAPIVDSAAPNGVGNVFLDANGSLQELLYFSKSWQTEDPDGRWIKVETRPLPVLKRPDAVVAATVLA